MLRPRTLCCLLLLVSLVVPTATARADALADDLRERRARLTARLGPESVAIFWSAPERVYSHTVNYEYRQDSNLLYLTGITQQDTLLVLMPGHVQRKEILLR